MVTKITYNKIKKGTAEEYIAASKRFEEDLVKRTTCMSAKVYKVDGDDQTVINIEIWPDKESATTSHLTEVFEEHLPNLIPFFAGNDAIVLYEV